jgi:hypothetical protein
MNTDKPENHEWTPDTAGNRKSRPELGVCPRGRAHAPNLRSSLRGPLDTSGLQAMRMRRAVGRSVSDAGPMRSAFAPRFALPLDTSGLQAMRKRSAVGRSVSDAGPMRSAFAPRFALPLDTSGLQAMRMRRAVGRSVSDAKPPGCRNAFLIRSSFSVPD